jgi:hypothetical protein
MRRLAKFVSARYDFFGARFMLGLLDSSLADFKQADRPDSRTL